MYYKEKKMPGHLGPVLCVLMIFPHLSVGCWFSESPVRDNIGVAYLLDLRSVADKSKALPKATKLTKFSWRMTASFVILTTVWESLHLWMLLIHNTIVPSFHFRKNPLLLHLGTKSNFIAQGWSPPSHWWFLILPSSLVITPSSLSDLFLTLIFHNQTHDYLNRQFTSQS